MDLLRNAHLRPASTFYVLLVAATAAAGFVVGSPVPILLAAAAALPASMVTMPLFYVVSGLMGLVPGANPSTSSGSGSSSAPGDAGTSHETGAAASWFTVTTHVVGVLALALAAIANVLLVRAIRSRWRTAKPVTVDR